MSRSNGENDQMVLGSAFQLFFPFCSCILVWSLLVLKYSLKFQRISPLWKHEAYQPENPSQYLVLSRLLMTPKGMCSVVHGPAQSRKPGQARPSQAIGGSLGPALAWLRVSESQSRRLRPRLWSCDQVRVTSTFRGWLQQCN